MHLVFIVYAFPYGCGTRCPTLKEGSRLKVFENRVLRRISRLKRDEMVGNWRCLHIEELHNLYSSPNRVNEDEMDGHVA
jgi:hypothetical protein